MAITRLTFVNQRGIPTLETVGNTLTTTELTYSFNRHPALNMVFQGVFIVKVTDTPTAPSTAVPIYFDSVGVSNSSIAVTNAAGTALTTATWPGDGIYIFFYDRATNILRLLTGNIS